MAKKLDEEAGKPNLTPETFLECLQGIRRAKRGVDEATGVYRAARKLAKDRGVDMASLAMMEQLARLDEDECRTRVRLLKLYMVWDGGGEQLEMFGAEQVPMPTKRATEQHTRFMADEAGFAAYKGKIDLDDNPHKAGTENHQAWSVGWRRGEAGTAMQMGENAGVTVATAKRGLKKPTVGETLPLADAHQVEQAATH